MAPPIVGPIFGANPIATPAIPIAVALRPSGKCVIAIVCNTGSSMPAAAACIRRPTNSDTNPPAHAHTADPAANNATDPAERSFRRKRPMKYAERGTTAPRTNMYAVVRDWPKPVEIPNSAHTVTSMALRPVCDRLPKADPRTTTPNIA